MIYFPPKTCNAFCPSTSSSSTFGPFKAKKVPPTLIKEESIHIVQLIALLHVKHKDHTALDIKF